MRRLTHTEIKKLQEMLRVLPTQLLVKNTSNLKRKSSILLHVKRRESTRQSFPAVMVRQVESGKSVLELQCSSAAQQAAELRQKNRDILLRLLRSAYFLANNGIPHTQFIRI